MGGSRRAGWRRAAASRAIQDPPGPGAADCTAVRAVLARRAIVRSPDDPHVFRHIPPKVWRAAWRRACQVAGVPGRRLHDCRRTAARNLVRAGVPERVAMMLLGHTTRSIFERYNIVNERDLHDAGQRLQQYVDRQATAASPA